MDLGEESDSAASSSATIDELVGERVLASPGWPAVIDSDGTVVSYAELWQAAGDLATRLPIADGEVVGVSMERGRAAVIAMLAVLRAGGAYCPTSPADPPVRTRRLQERVGMRFVLHADERGTITIDDRGGAGRVLDVADDRPVYVMWTSGSTGDPKAVVIPHRGVVRLVRDRTLMDPRPDDRVAFASNPMFDATTWEVWSALSNGATIVVIDSTDLVDAARLRSRFETAGVTRVWLTTSLFDLLATADASMFGGLRTVVVGGEQVRTRTIRSVLTSDSPPDHVVNGYGPTECTVFATSHRVRAEDLVAPRIPIGSPLANTVIAVVDDNGRPVPTGDEGELWLGGDGVALGYLGDDGLVLDRFVDAELDEGGRRRWYRTGDIVRVDEHGCVDCLGRIDRQVKIRGHRVEPIEIEHGIATFEGVAEVAVVADRSSDNVRLHAFIVRNPPMNDDDSFIDQIRDRLRAEFPAYMVPARLTVVDGLPLTANGKLDTAALLTVDAPPPTDGPSGSASDPPDPMVSMVLEQARVVLAHPHLGPDDDLWDAGLDSLAAVELASALSTVLDRGIHPTEFVGHPTATAIAALVHTSRDGQSDGVTVFDPSSTADPMFVVIGRGTSPLAFRHMARDVTTIHRSLVVLESAELRPSGPSGGWVESVARSVADEVERRKPDGVVLLGGWSAGGVIATEATSLLEQRGRDVRLMLFDTTFLARGRGQRTSVAMAVVRHLARRLRDAFVGRKDRSEVDGERSDQAGAFIAQIRELRAYGAPPPISAPVANFHVAGSVSESVVASALPGSTAIEVGGHHNTMFNEPYSATLVAHLADWLADADPSSPDRSEGQRRPTPS